MIVAHHYKFIDGHPSMYSNFLIMQQSLTPLDKLSTYMQLATLKVLNVIMHS